MRPCLVGWAVWLTVCQVGEDPLTPDDIIPPSLRGKVLQSLSKEAADSGHSRTLGEGRMVPLAVTTLLTRSALTPQHTRTLH